MSMNKKNNTRTSLVQAWGFYLTIVVTAIILVTSVVSASAEMSREQASKVLASISSHSGGVAKAVYKRAAAGEGMTATDRKVLKADLATFSSDPKKAGGVEAIKIALGGKSEGKKSSRRSALARKECEPFLKEEGTVATPATALDLDVPPSMTVTTAQKNRAISAIQSQITCSGGPVGEGGIVASGTTEKAVRDMGLLTEAAKAGSASLQGQKVDGDLLSYAAVLISSAKRAERDAAQLSGPNRQAALRVAAAYRAAAASLGGTLKVEEQDPPQPAVPISAPQK